MSPPHKPPLVSVCIPTYNGREHLRECLDSVRAQTFKDFEVVICDDESLDGTLDFARELAQGDERFRFIRNPRRFGLVGNWNNCVEMSKGDWIKFLFQDDLLKPNCLEMMVRVAMAQKAQFVCCRRDFLFAPEVPQSVCEDYHITTQRIDAFYGGRSPMSAEQFARGVVARFRDNLVGEPPVTLLHRGVFEKCGWFNPNLIMACDYEFWNRVGSVTGVVFIPAVLATFRVHGKSTSAENLARREFRMTLLDWFILLHEVAYGEGRAALRGRLPRKKAGILSGASAANRPSSPGNGFRRQKRKTQRKVVCSSRNGTASPNFIPGCRGLYGREGWRRASAGCPAGFAEHFQFQGEALRR